MSQIYPNYQRPDSALGGPAPIQTTRVKYTVTSNDHSQGDVNISVTLPFAFADANYTIQWAVEGPTNNLVNSYVGMIYGKTASGFNLLINTTDPQASPGAGDVLVIHVTATHD